MSSAKFISYCALVLVLGPCLLFCAGAINLAATQTTVLIATIVWFSATPLWAKE